MSIDTPPIPPNEEAETSQRKRKITLDFLYGLIILLIIVGGLIGLLSSPIFTGEDSLLTGLFDKIDQLFTTDSPLGSENAPDQEDQDSGRRCPNRQICVGKDHLDTHETPIRHQSLNRIFGNKYVYPRF